MPNTIPRASGRPASESVLEADRSQPGRFELAGLCGGETPGPPFELNKAQFVQPEEPLQRLIDVAGETDAVDFIVVDEQERRTAGLDLPLLLTGDIRQFNRARPRPVRIEPAHSDVPAKAGPWPIARARQWRAERKMEKFGSGFLADRGLLQTPTS